MTVSQSITASIPPQRTSMCTPSLQSSFIMTPTHPQHIAPFFQSPLVTSVTYQTCTARTQTHTHARSNQANPITDMSSLVLNPCNPGADFTVQHHFLLHHSGRSRGSRTTNQGQQRQPASFSPLQDGENTCSLFSLFSLSL